MTEQQQTENRDILQQDSQRIDLDTPLMMGDLKIESLEIRKPNVAALQGNFILKISRIKIRKLVAFL